MVYINSYKNQDWLIPQSVKNPNRSKLRGIHYESALGFLLPEMGIESRSRAAGYNSGSLSRMYKRENYPFLYKTHFSGIKDMIPEKHVCFFVEEFVESLDFLNFDKLYEGAGHPASSAVLLPGTAQNEG